jgi:electron transport complex protein RnfG
MEKLESSLKNMLISLGGIALVCALLLSVVNALTEKKILKVTEAKTARAIAKVLPSYGGATIDTTVTLGGESFKVHKAMADDTTVAGYAIETSTAGFGGPLNLMVGFTSEGRICSTDVISHTETPGLGAKITDASSHFRTQFESRNPAEFNLAIKKNGGDVDAISASTITSQAFTSAVAKAYSVYLAASGNGADAVSSATPQAGEGGSDEAN